SSGIPGPSSSTSMATRPFSGLARTSTFPPVGECRMAFSSRLATTWCTRSGSPSATSPGSSTDTETCTWGGCNRDSSAASSPGGQPRRRRPHARLGAGVDDQHRDDHGGHDHRAELPLDGRQPVERAAGGEWLHCCPVDLGESSSSPAAYPTPWTVRMTLAPSL